MEQIRLAAQACMLSVLPGSGLSMVRGVRHSLFLVGPQASTGLGR